MYKTFRQYCEWVLRIPAQPEPPPGDEAQTRVFRAAPQYYKYLLALWSVKTAAALVFLLFLSLGPLAAIYGRVFPHNRTATVIVIIVEAFAFLGAVLSRVFALALVRLDFEQRWYLVTDRSLRVREGIVQVREATVTFANIQNISISQGPIQRLLGIADLRVDTAGGGGAVQEHQGGPNLHVVRFRGVDNAAQIKELMQQRLRSLKDSGLGDHEELAARRPASAPAASPSLVAALREVHAEAAALRAAAARQAATANTGLSSAGG